VPGIFAFLEERIIVVIAITNRHLIILRKYLLSYLKDIRTSDPEDPRAPTTPEKEAAKPAPQPTEPEKANPTPAMAS
jgi:hypothetical protein